MFSDSSAQYGTDQSSTREGSPAAITDVGCERDINEDRYAVVDCSAGKLWVVCDGMGGVQGGELAAQLAIDAMRRGVESNEFETPSEALQAAVDEANRRIVLRRQNPAFQAMGTTVVAAMLSGDEVIIGYAGDSRAYLVRGTEIQQLSVDHTYVQDLVERGLLSEDDALNHPQAHVLTRCLGAEPRLALDSRRYWLWDTEAGETNDVLVLCSDGLYSHVADVMIAEQIAQHPPQEACLHLVELAKQDGGYDNITVVILPLNGQLREDEPPAEQSSRRLQRSSLETVEDGSNFSLSKHLMIAFFIAVLGAVLTTLLIFLRISSA